MKIKRFDDLNESKKNKPSKEEWDKMDEWDQHIWLCDNDTIYKKAWEDAIERHQMSLDPKDRLKEYKDK